MFQLSSTSSCFQEVQDDKCMGPCRKSRGHSDLIVVIGVVEVDRHLRAECLCSHTFLSSPTKPNSVYDLSPQAA